MCRGREKTLSNSSQSVCVSMFFKSGGQGDCGPTIGARQSRMAGLNAWAGLCWPSLKNQDGGIRERDKWETCVEKGIDDLLVLNWNRRRGGTRRADTIDRKWPNDVVQLSKEALLFSSPATHRSIVCTRPALPDYHQATLDAQTPKPTAPRNEISSVFFFFSTSLWRSFISFWARACWLHNLLFVC